MPTLPAELLPLIVDFAPLFSKRVWEHAQVLLVGRDPRTRQTDRHRLLARHGEEPGEAFSELPSSAEPSPVVGDRGQSVVAPTAGQDFRA